MSNTKIMNIIGENEISVNEAKELLNFVYDKLHASGFWTNIMSIDELFKEDIERAINRIKNLSSVLIEVEKKFKNELENSFNRTEEVVNKHYKQMRNLEDKISSITVDFPEINLPSKWKELFDFADIFSSMSKEKQKKFMEFIHTFQ